MRVKVIKLSTNTSDYRTPVDELDGMPYPPVVGMGLVLTSSTFDSGGIYTSNLKSVVETEEGYIIETQGSKYEIIRR